MLGSVDKGEESEGNQKRYLQSKTIQWFMKVNNALHLHMVFTSGGDAAGAPGQHSSTWRRCCRPAAPHAGVGRGERDWLDSGS